MNKALRSQIVSLATLAFALGGALATTLATAAEATMSAAEARAQFEQDRAFCRSPESSQNVANCLHEAAAAYDEALWKARGRAESPRAALEPKPQALASGLGTMPEGSALGSGTGTSPRSDRR